MHKLKTENKRKKTELRSLAYSFGLAISPQVQRVSYKRETDCGGRVFHGLSALLCVVVSNTNQNLRDQNQNPNQNLNPNLNLPDQNLQNFESESESPYTSPAMGLGDRKTICADFIPR